MDFLTEWITNIILFILLATVIDMLMPNSSLQKYVKVVISLLLITIILSPIMKLFSSDFESAIASITSLQAGETSANIENSIELQKKEIQASHHAYILKQTAAHLQLEVEEELMEQYGMNIVAIDIQAESISENLSPESLQSIKVVLQNGDRNPAVTAVKEVTINTAEPLPSVKHENQLKEIETLLSETWNVPRSAIELNVEGGT